MGQEQTVHVHIMLEDGLELVLHHAGLALLHHLHHTVRLLGCTLVINVKSRVTHDR